MELKKGYKQTEVGLIPDDWKLMSIDQIFDFYSTSNYSKAQMLTDGEVGCFHYGLIHSLPNNNYAIRTGVKYFVTKQQAKYEFIKEGDVVMVDASEDLSGVNKSIEISGVQDKLYISGLHTYLLRDRGFFEKYFRGPILNSHFTKAQFYRLAVGMKVFGVSKQQLKTVLLPIPTKSEQTAIANALSDTDAYITSLEKLIKKKRQIKQGAMQELLKPRKGWEEKLFKNVCWFQEGPGLRNWQFTTRGIKVINVTNLENGLLNLDKTDRHISLEEFHKMYKHFEIQENDIVVASSGNSYGKVSVVRKQDLPLLMNTSVIRFKPSKELDYNFLLTFLKSNQFKNQIDLLITGGAQPNFGPFHLNKISINLPQSKQEQIRVATILYSMDTEIAELEIKLEKFKKVKSGMMQQLLTGKIRII